MTTFSSNLNILQCSKANPHSQSSTGQMIVQIRAFTGASLRCSELDEDNRLVLIIGSLVQVLNAFDVIIQVISPTIVQANSSGQRPLSLSPASSGNQGEPVMVCLLLEQGKTGRVVGSKGSTLLALKQRSGATVRVEKETTVSPYFPHKSVVSSLLIYFLIR